MRKVIIVTIILAVAGIFTAVTFAGSRPDYNCGKAERACERGCDQRAESSKNANAYNRCLEGCRESAKRCEKRQQSTNSCADAFQGCIRSASSKSDREGCRAAYRACKGHR